MHRLYAYLCRTRGIDHDIVTRFVRAGTLYEDAERHNAVFLATDERGKPVGGMKKCTLSGSKFRQTITGSDTRYSFCHKGTSGRVYVFEAAVDMLSFISMHKQNWQQHSYIALDGLSPKALLCFLDKHDMSEVILCLDNDEPGIAAAERIGRQLQDRGCENVSVLLPRGKDWNCDIVQMQEIDMMMSFNVKRS